MMENDFSNLLESDEDEGERDSMPLALRLKLLSIKKALEALSNRPSASRPAVIQKIFPKFIECLNPDHLPVCLKDVSQVWGLLKIPLGRAASHLPSNLFRDFLQNCFCNVDQEQSHDLMRTMIVDCATMGFLSHVKHRSSKEVFEILDFLLVQLLKPGTNEFHIASKLFFQSCKWNVAYLIQEMLNGALLNNNNDADYQWTDHRSVYQIIFELIVIRKDLVVGLVNNTEMCLAGARIDRYDGLTFFCQLFSSTKISNAVSLYSYLWTQFLGQRVSISEPLELKLLAKHTPNILNQPTAHKDWCCLLFDLLQFDLPQDCEKAFVLAIISAVKGNPSLLNDKGPETLAQLIQYFFTPYCVYQLFDDSRDLLVANVSEIYKETVLTSIKYEAIETLYETSSWLLSCLLRTFSSFAPPNERWIQLRSTFVSHIVCHDLDAETRMEMLLHLWMYLSSDDKSILHELFAKIVRVRSNLLWILYVLENKSISKRYLPYRVRLIHQMLIRDIAGEYPKHFLPVLLKDKQVRVKLFSLLSGNMSCEENFQMAKSLITTLTMEDLNLNIVHDFLYYVTELTTDKTALKYLVKRVDTYVLEDATSYFGRKRLSAALQLLREVLFMSPHLGFDADVLEHILKWSQLLNSSLSSLALRCLVSISGRNILEKWNKKFTEDQMLPLWLQIIQFESRSQVKMALKCVGGHLADLRKDVLQEIFYIISYQLKDPSNQKRFERGVAAIGHFSAICPLFLKRKVEDLCISVLLHYVVRNNDGLEDIYPNSFASESTSNTWVDWQELPYHVSVKVQALKSIGRCMRYCGSPANILKTLESLLTVLTLPSQGVPGEREVDRAYLRFEAASAILNVLETAEFQSNISKELLLALSQILLDPRIEVRTCFAKKLCQGLSPHKKRLDCNGRSRGSLPPCMLGLLAFLGSSLWRRSQESIEKAEMMVKQVFVSRHISVKQKCHLFQLTLQEFYEQSPLLVLENILAAAVPMLSELPTSLPTIDWQLEMAQCLKFICSMLCHFNTYGGQVTKQYMMNMVNAAKQILSSVKPTERMNYALVLELLELVLKRYNTAAKEPITPPVQLPQPFFNGGNLEPPQNEERLLSTQQLKNIERKLYRGQKQKPTSNLSEDKVMEETTYVDEENHSLYLSSETNISSQQDEGGDVGVPYMDTTFQDESLYHFFGIPPTASTPLKPHPSHNLF